MAGNISCRLFGRPGPRRQFESRKIETRRDGAAAKRPITERLHRLPGMSRHDRLRALAGGEIAAERQALDASRRRRDFKRQRRAGIPMPNLDGVDPVPVRALAAPEQKIDRGRRRARSRHLLQIAKRLAKISALRMRLEIEKPDHGIRGQRLRGKGYRQNRFLRSRISANTFQAGLPPRPSDFASSALSARRNGLAAFSAPIVAGMVGAPAPISFATSSARAASALLCGSMCLAKRILAWVYSWPQ